MSPFWKPTHKYQLVEWLESHYPMTHKSFKHMKKKQLYAIYINTRIRYVEGR